MCSRVISVDLVPYKIIDRMCLLNDRTVRSTFSYLKGLQLLRKTGLPLPLIQT